MRPLVRPARLEDVPVLHGFVIALAEEEEFPGEVLAQPHDLELAIFGPTPAAQCVIVEIGGSAAGFAIYYPTYSTVLGRRGLHLEDLYVVPEHRGSGLGLALLTYLARLAVDAGCGRLEWWVLRTNEPALKFYARLGARSLDELEVQRLEGTDLRDVAEQRYYRVATSVRENRARLP